MDRGPARLFLDWLSLFDAPISLSAARTGQDHVPPTQAEALLEAWERRGWVERHPAAIDSAVDGIVDGFTLTAAGREQAVLERH